METKELESLLNKYCEELKLNPAIIPKAIEIFNEAKKHDEFSQTHDISLCSASFLLSTHIFRWRRTIDEISQTTGVSSSTISSIRHKILNVVWDTDIIQAERYQSLLGDSTPRIIQNIYKKIDNCNNRIKKQIKKEEKQIDKYKREISCRKVLARRHKEELTTLSRLASLYDTGGENHG